VRAGELERWLLQGRLAEQTPARLIPTPLGAEIADGFDAPPAFGG
jgi:hypothetical protein